MTFLLSAKGHDITAWRAAAEFATNYRQNLMDRAVSGHFGTSEELFSGATSTLDKLIEEHESLMAGMEGMLTEIGQADHPRTVKELSRPYYKALYRHMELFNAAPAFYEMSMAFLRQASSSLIKYASGQMGVFAQRMPEVSLVALGPAGRSEFTPFCPLQLLLVHGETDPSGLETLALFSQVLHSGFEEIGLRIDSAVTPRNPAWRGTVAQWKQRCTDGLQTMDDVINLLRLSDQQALSPDQGLGQELSNVTVPQLQASRQAANNLISRMASLSNGLSMMGNLKLERRRPETGLFCLLDHGLLPLSSATTVLTLIKKATAQGTLQRIRELVSRRELDIDLAENILATWHTIHEFLLLRERVFTIGPNNNLPLYLDPDELDEARLSQLKGALESVEFIQKQVTNIFYRMEE